jgi:type IV secretion system protein VirB6
MDLCPAIPHSAGFISSITGFIDCQSQVLGSGAWNALAAPGSTLAVVLMGFLTIFITLVGYNLLLGQSITVRSGTTAIVKIGAVFALATSWPAYRTLVYDLVTVGPSQLVSEIGPQAGVVGSDGTLTQRLDVADQSLAQLAVVGPGTPPPNAAANIPPALFGGFDSFALGGSRILFELTALSALGIVRIIAGLMLALGPFFIAFLMFENTRGLFEGWMRVLAGTALAAIGGSIALGLELALIEPWLSDVLARRMTGEALPTVSTELFALSTAFALMTVAALWASFRVASAFQLPAAPAILVLERRTSAHLAVPAVTLTAVDRARVGNGRSRAAVIRTALIATRRRDSSGEYFTDGTLAARSPQSRDNRNNFSPSPTFAAQHTPMRFAKRRLSLRAVRRDAAS